MPMYTVVRCDLDPPETVTSYDNPAEAAQMAHDSNTIAKIRGQPYRYRVVKPVSTRRCEEWRKRELARFADGIYKPVPWHLEDWYLHSDFFDLHFPHVSTEAPASLAFTPDEEAGIADRHTRMRPGRYLERYFPGIGCHLSNHWTQIYIELHDTLEVQFAATANDIQWVYQHGPHSCMSGSRDHYSSPFHPVRVYAGPDLQVAYLTDPEEPKRVVARCVCWPEKKRYTTIYGDATRLRGALTKLDYEPGCLDGARIARHMKREYYVVPYIDNCSGLDDDGEYLVLGGDEISSCNTNGLSETTERCENCGDSVSEDNRYHVDGVDQYWCHYCYENCTWHCDNCENNFSEEEANSLSTVDGCDICERCAQRYYRQCDDCENYAHVGRPARPHVGEFVCDSCQETRDENAAAEAAEDQAELPLETKPSDPLTDCLEQLGICLTTLGE